MGVPTKCYQLLRYVSWEGFNIRYKPFSLVLFESVYQGKESRADDERSTPDNGAVGTKGLPLSVPGRCDGK